MQVIRCFYFRLATFDGNQYHIWLWPLAALLVFHGKCCLAGSRDFYSVVDKIETAKKREVTMNVERFLFAVGCSYPTGVPMLNSRKNGKNTSLAKPPGTQRDQERQMAVAAGD